jgi:hypothetical protein
LPCSRQKAIESEIIARFSSRVTRITFSTWSGELLPTRQTAGANDDVTTLSASSSAAGRSRRRVMPNATTVAFLNSTSPSRSKNSASFGLLLGKPASMKWTPSASNAWATLSFSPTERDMPRPPMPSRKVVS